MPEKIKTKNEWRTYPVILLGIEKRDADEPEKIVGHAAVFNQEGDGGWFREMIAPGAFADSIQKDDIRALFNHDANFVLGRNTAKTLSLREDEKGLWVEIAPPETQWANDLKVSISRGDISQMSFAFQIIKEERQHFEDKNLTDLFIIREAKLWDVSPVTFPFYEQTDVSIHSRESWVEEEKRQKSIPIGMRLNLLRQEFDLKRLG